MGGAYVPPSTLTQVALITCSYFLPCVRATPVKFSISRVRRGMTASLQGWANVFPRNLFFLGARAKPIGNVRCMETQELTAPVKPTAVCALWLGRTACAQEDHLRLNNMALLISHTVRGM